jgi:hypothetical protein
MEMKSEMTRIEELTARRNLFILLVKIGIEAARDSYAIIDMDLRVENWLFYYKKKKPAGIAKLDSETKST